jgi:hypothetical protein
MLYKIALHVRTSNSAVGASKKVEVIAKKETTLGLLRLRIVLVDHGLPETHVSITLH